MAFDEDVMLEIVRVPVPVLVKVADCGLAEELLKVKLVGDN